MQQRRNAKRRSFQREKNIFIYVIPKLYRDDDDDDDDDGTSAIDRTDGPFQFNARR